ncbi:MAG: hypothetical protein ACT4P2_13880 [Pseudomonadota bacterium]
MTADFVRLGGGEGIAMRGNVPARPLGVPVLGHDEECDKLIADCPDRRTIRYAKRCLRAGRW